MQRKTSDLVEHAIVLRTRPSIPTDFALVASGVRVGNHRQVRADLYAGRGSYLYVAQSIDRTWVVFTVDTKILREIASTATIHPVWKVTQPC